MAYRKLGRDNKHRRSMLANLTKDVIMNEKIVTTETRAKEVRSLVDKMITYGKNGSLVSRRKALAFLQNDTVAVKKVLYSELDDYGIDGAYGYLENSEIVVPKTIENDNRFLYRPVKRLYQKHSYGTPLIDEFGAVVFLQDSLEENSDKIYNAVKSSINFKNLYSDC